MEPDRAPRYSPIALTALIAANILPLIGVLFFRWDLLSIMLLYWLENGIIGLFTIPRIFLAQGRRGAAARGSPIMRLFLSVFFTFHYGVFWTVHGALVFVLFSGMSRMPMGPLALVDQVVEIAALSLWLAVGVLVISHAVSFVLNFILRGEYRTVSPDAMMSAPYARVLLLHLTLLMGGFMASLLGAPVGALIVMVLLKTGLDVASHLRQHRNMLSGSPKNEAAAA